MEVTFHIPDDSASRVAAAGELSRRALEAFALEELRAGRITEPQLREMLGLARIHMDGFLKSHGIFQEYTLEDFEQERQALEELGSNWCGWSSPIPADPLPDPDRPYRASAGCF